MNFFDIKRVMINTGKTVIEILEACEYAKQKLRRMDQNDNNDLDKKS